MFTSENFFEISDCKSFLYISNYLHFLISFLFDILCLQKEKSNEKISLFHLVEVKPTGK